MDATATQSPSTAARNRVDDIRAWLARGRAEGASDLHIVPGSAPRLRIGGVLAPIPDTPPLSGTDTHDLIRGLLHTNDLGEEWETFRHEDHDLDLGLKGRHGAQQPGWAAARYGSTSGGRALVQPRARDR